MPKSKTQHRRRHRHRRSRKTRNRRGGCIPDWYNDCKHGAVPGQPLKP